MELFKRFMLPISMLILAAGFWFYPHFERLAAGIAVFLFGLKMLELGVQGLSGGLLEKTLEKATRSTGRALLFGFSTSSLVQSSTLVMVLAISFLSAGMIPLGTGIGIVFGANLGTTTGTWLIGGLGLSISLTQIALPLIIFGVLLLLQTRALYKSIGNMLLGMGFLFLGIDYIKDGFASIQYSFDFSLLASDNFFDNCLLFLVGFLITVVLQSSHATLLLTLSALAANHISFTSSAALTVGACVGTTVIPLLSSLGANASGRRLALMHFIFNFFTALIVLPTLPILLWSISTFANLIGIASDFYPLKLAIFHSLYSLIGISIMWPNQERLKRLLLKLIPEKEVVYSKVQYLNEAALESSATAITVARSETNRLYNIANNIMVEGLGWYSEEFNQGWPLDQLSNANKNATPIDVQALYELQVKNIYSEIISFISLARTRASDVHDEQLRELWAANYHLVEAIKGIKHLQKNMPIYLVNKNSDIANTYQSMRLQIGEVLRANQLAHGTKEPIESRLALDHQKLLTERINNESNSLIEDLIRSRKITPSMATSLMTDKGYVYKICISLITTGSYLFIDLDKPQADTPPSLVLETTDLGDINQKLNERRSEASMEERA